jgi:hypothetical protein
MPAQPPRAKRRSDSRRATATLAALAVMLAAAAAHAQNQQTTPTPPAPAPARPTTTQNGTQNQSKTPAVPQRPATTNTAQSAQPPASRWHLPFIGTNKNPTASTNQGNPGTPGNPANSSNGNQPTHFWDRILGKSTNNPPAASNAPKPNINQPRPPGNAPINPAQNRTPSNGTPALSNLRNSANPAPHVASIGPSSQGSVARSVPSQMFPGHPGPPGSHEIPTQKGNIVRRDPYGSVIDVRSPANGMFIHHGLNGSRQVTVEQSDGSRIFTSSRGTAYVQHPFSYQAHLYDQRTYYAQGRTSRAFYRPYSYGGTTLDVYATTRFYSPEVYQWTTTRFSAPHVPGWNFVATPTPWFTYYKGYFTPEPAYTNPLSWMADYVLAMTLFTAYSTHPPAAPAAASAPSAPSAPSPQPSAADAPPVITPDVKEKIAAEVGRQVKQESKEAQQNAQQNAQSRDLPPGQGGVVEELGDKESHVFVVASDLDLVDPTGRRCTVSEGDVVEVVSAAKPDTVTADAVVLASKGGTECGRSAQVEIALSDLQEMQNHMRETIDQGLATSNNFKDAATVTPGFAESAPPPDADVAHEIDRQQKIAAAAES